MSERATRVMVSGSTGFVGNHVASELLDHGLTPVCVARKESRTRDIEFLHSLRAEVHQVDIAGHDPRVTDVLTTCSAFVHLIGSIAPKRGETFLELHRGSAEFFFDCARRASVDRIVFVTALGSGPDALSEYHRTKWLAEEALRGIGIDHAILRPSLVIGRSVGHRDSKLVRRYLDLIAKKNKVPLLLGGANRVQPLFVGDLAACVRLALDRTSSEGPIFELAGPEPMTTRQFVEMLMDVVGVTKPTFSIPGFVANVLAFFAERLQDVPLVSRDQIKIARMDGVTTHNAVTDVFGVEPRGVREALQAYA